MVETTSKETIWSFPYVALMAVNFFQSMAAFMTNTTLPVYLDALGASVDDEVEMLLSPDVPPVMFRSASGLIEVVMGVKPGVTLAQAINGNSNGNGED